MKKILSKIISFVLIISLFSACGKDNVKNNQKEEKQTIYTSFYALQSVTKEIVGDKMEVKNLIPNGQGVHHWEPTAKDMKDLYKGSVILVNGLNLETWTEKFKSALTDLKLVEVSKGVNLLETAHHHEEGEDHEHEHKHEHEHEHEHEQEHEHEHEHKGENKDVVKPMTEKEEKHHSHGKYDPHIWLSLRNMKVVAKNICDQVISMDKANESYYKENLKKVENRLDELDKKYSDELKNSRTKSIITSHEAFAYLFNDYGLKQIAIEGLNSESEPDLAKMKSIVEQAKKEGLKYVFYEELSESKVEETIAKEIGGQVKMLYTIEGQTEEQAKENKDYFKMMEENLKALVEATK